MHTKAIAALLLSLIALLGATSTHAGQVVTEADRNWAREAIAQEKALASVLQNNTLAVLYFHNKTGRPEFEPWQKGLTVMLSIDLAKLKQLQVLERARLQALVEELGLGVSGLVDTTTAPRVGRFVRAHYLVGGEFGQDASSAMTIFSNLLDVSKESVLTSTDAKGMVEELFKMEKKLLFAIIKALGIEVTPEQEAELRKPISEDYNALFALFQAIDLSDRGEYGKAAEQYRSALALDPSLPLAAEGLQELIDLGLIGGGKKKSNRWKGKSFLNELRDRSSYTDNLIPIYPVKRIRTPDEIVERERLLNDDLCPTDPLKTEPGICGCGVPDIDSDNDGIMDCNDSCPADPLKTEPGVCGCGIADVDIDGDGIMDCTDLCPDDPLKTAPGVCGCGVPDIDSDNDGTMDCSDLCPADPLKTEPGICGCGIADIDSDGDGTMNCVDLCPADPAKSSPGICGCGVPDTDSDNDGTPDCNDRCPNDPLKIAPGSCGCGVADTDSDGDNTLDCFDGCPFDSLKTSPGICGCGVADTDRDGDELIDCLDGCPDDPMKTDPGICGCGLDDSLDSDEDGTVDCLDGCPLNPNLTEPDPEFGCGGEEVIPLPIGG
ncbi:MAG: CsgG/HfaB family protein [Thermodesulfobacteriota bacterium]